MSSGFSGGAGGPDFFTAAGGLSGRSSFMNTNNPQNPYRSQLAGISVDPSSQINQRRPDFMGKRTLAEFQTHNLQQQQQQQQQRQSLFNHPQNLQQQQLQQQQQQLLGLYLRSVKPRIYQNSSPISPLSPIDFSGSIMPEIPSLSSSPANLMGRYGIPMVQQLRSQQMNLNNQSLPIGSYPNLVQERVIGRESETETEKKMMNRLQELEKELLDDIDEHCDDASVVTGSEWSDTIQSLITPNQKLIPPSPTSSSSTSSSSTSVASPAPMCSKQSLMETASAISEGKSETASEIITRLSHQRSNPQGSPEQRMVFYMTAALKSRLSPTENPPPVSELFGKEHMESTQSLFHHSLSFKLGFMAANLAIIEATAEAKTFHVVDFNIGQGLQYQNLLQLLSLRKSGKPTVVKITAVEDVVNGGKERFIAVREKLRQLGEQAGISVQLNNLSLKISDLSRESMGCDSEEVLVVNFAYTLFRIADESVSTENPRDQLLRRVKGLGPRLTTVVEQEMNCNTTQFVSRVNECCNYYGALFESLDSSMARDNPERVKLEEGLSRKLGNSIACEGRERVERCEVFGKWRARMGMAGFELKPVSPPVTESLRARVNSGTRVNPGMTVKEENGGVCFGWMGRTLIVASAWR